MQNAVKLFHKIRQNTHTQLFYNTFSGSSRVSRRQILFWTFIVQGKITEGRHTDHPDGRHPSKIIGVPPPSFPHFYAGYHSYCNPPTLSWLGTGTKYAGLHTSWCG